jgi:hypothetical protein
MSTENQIFESVFDFDASEMSVVNTESTGVEHFNPKPDGAKTYVCTLRLGTNLKNPQQSIVHKKYYWLNDGADFGYDSPTSINEFCPISRQYWALKNTKDPVKEKLADKLPIQKRYECFVQIVKDVNNTANEGKILPWRIPVPVFKIIQGWIKPTEEDLKAGKKPKPLFNVFESFNIVLTVSNKIVNGQTMRDYKAELDDEKTAMFIDGKPVTNTEEGRKMFLDYFNEQQPTLDIVAEYGYKEADAATKARVKSLLVSVYGAADDFWPEIAVNSNQQTAQQNSAPSIVQQEQPTAPAQATTEQPAAPAQATTEQPTAPAQVTAESVDDILNTIGS